MDNAYGFPEGRRESASGGAAVLSLAVSADGDTTVAGTADGTVLRWRANTSWYRGPSDSVTSLDFHPDGKSVSAGDAEGEVHTWNPWTGEQVGRPVDMGNPILALEYTKDGVRITGGVDATFTAKPGVGKQHTITLDDREFHNGMAVSPDGKWLAAAHQASTSDGDRDNKITVWRAAGLTRHAVLELGEEWPFELAFSPDSRQLVAITNQVVAVSQDQAPASMRTWRAPEFENTEVVRLSENTALSAAVFQNDQTLITGGASGKIEVRDAATGRLRYEFGEHPAPIRQLALSPDGHTVASVAGDDLTVRLWDVRDRKLVANLTGSADELNEVEFGGANGELLATGGDDTDVAIWHTDPDEAIRLVCANLADAGEHDLDKIGCP